jgi:hypothetical protein
MINITNNGIANGRPNPNGIKNKMVIIEPIVISIAVIICIIAPKLAVIV